MWLKLAAQFSEALVLKACCSSQPRCALGFSLVPSEKRRWVLSCLSLVLALALSVCPLTAECPLRKPQELMADSIVPTSSSCLEWPWAPR